MFAIEAGLNMLYQKADISTSRSKFIKSETIIVSEFISSIIENYAAV